MQTLLTVFLALALLAIAVLLFIIAAIRLGLKEITSQLQSICDGGTNAQISISTCDAGVKKLAAQLNGRIADMRAKELKYTNGDREVKTALTNAAHDLRTPLTAVLGYLDLIEHETDRDKCASYIKIMHERAYALKKLSEELFGYSIAADGYRAENLQTLDAGEILKECLADFYEQFNERNIVPKIDVSSLPLIADKYDLIRLFSNLIQNALKYASDSFEVTLKGSEITFSNTAADIDSIDAGRLFDRFYTVNSGKSSTGLGLSIAKTLTERLGGDIRAELNDGVLSIILNFTQR